jgi:hypothetical protein
MHVHAPRGIATGVTVLAALAAGSPAGPRKPPPCTCRAGRVSEKPTPPPWA